MAFLQLLLQMENTERPHRALSNGDLYIGDFNGVVPHGKGKYTWTDGTVYEGDWENGKMTGKGKIIWPSGANYEGDFSGGHLHGIGTFTATDSSEYRGAWRMNIEHGLGRKQYVNSDIYEGSWKEGAHEGSGRYSWNNGNTYIGNWKGGRMNGRGVMKWANGDLFDGFWLNGLRHGSGVYKFEDGGYYFGTWSKELKDGKGQFYPSGVKIPSLRKWCSLDAYDESGRSSNLLSHSYSLNSDQSSVPKVSVIRSFSEKISFARISHRTMSLDESWRASDSSRESGSRVAYEREYVQGVLVKERVITRESSCKIKPKTKFRVKEEKKKSCVEFSDGRQSYYLMFNLQLGIRYTVGKITPVPRREVRNCDFGDQARISMYFPKKGSRFTPPHYSVDFYWKDYCPMVFRNLREMFKLDAAEYMMSICGDDGLRDFSSPGKSGSIFYLSHDDRFVIKTLKKSELKFFLKMLPNYYEHVGKHENTLITKFFGVHRIKLKGGRKVRFVVMGNMFCTELRIHKRYDLKGSTQGRITEPEKIEANTTLKDLDLSYEFLMDKMLRESLFEQLSEDCKFLQSQQVIDYSLLLGLHFRAPEQLKAILESADSMPSPSNSPSDAGGSSRGEPLIPAGLLLVTHEPSSVNTAPGPHIRGNTLRAYSVGAKEVDLLLPGTARLRVQLGVNMPAQASRKIRQEVDSMEVELFEVYDVVLYMGIIDILQEYNARKKVENACKSMKFDPLSISAVEPKLYADRFLKFLQQKVFPEQP